MVVKFVPAMSTITPPLAGVSGLGLRRFFFFDGSGLLLYCGLFILLGYFFANQITQYGVAVSHISSGALKLLAVASVLYIAYKYWRRQRLLHELRMARITVEELRGKLDAGENLIILDMRSSAELELNPSIIIGAIHLGMDEVAKRHHEFPRDRDIIVYCSCPNEATAAKGGEVAPSLRLHTRPARCLAELMPGGPTISRWKYGWPASLTPSW